MNNFNFTNQQRSSSSSSSSSSGYASSSSSSSSGGTAYQQAMVSLDTENLKQPYTLSVKSSAAQLTGTITVNNRTIARLEGDRTQIDLSPHLSVGTNQVEILARYSPSSSDIKVSLVGKDTNVVQQTRSSGALQSTLTVLVS